jgi:hypothetical protein
MKLRPLLVAGGIGSILIFAPPMSALILVYVSPGIFTAPLWILGRWLAVQMPIQFLVGVVYALAADREAVNRGGIVRGAALAAFLVGMVGTASEILARIIPEALVWVHVFRRTDVPLDVYLLPILCIVFSGCSVFGAGFGALGAAITEKVRKPKSSKS